ncbi:MAG: hypothetical protein ABI460_01990 [Caldimonas sp.]
MSSTIPLRLDVELEPAGLKVRLRNLADQPMRIWALGNSWGGASWFLQLVAAGSQHERVLRPGKQPYTVNLPRFLEVPARGQRVIALTPGDLDWTFGEDLSALRDVPLGVRVVLEIAPSKEAVEQQVTTGRAESAELTSQPPHGWLFLPPAAS